MQWPPGRPACKKCGYKSIFNEQVKLHQVGRGTIQGADSPEISALRWDSGGRGRAGVKGCVARPRGGSGGRGQGGGAGRPGTGRTRAWSGLDGVLGLGPET